MFAGLILASLAALTSPAALFQRKARAGWLEELDGIRDAALGSDDLADPDEIWTDLREGGEYRDPHEIASLYADDSTPDDPARAKKQKGRSRPARPSRVDDVAPAAPAPTPAPVADELPPPPAAAELVDDGVWTRASGPVAPDPEVAANEAEQLRIQPAPHPVHPNEMWHPADLAPAPLADAVTPAAASTSLESEASAAPQAGSYDRLRHQFLVGDDPMGGDGDDGDRASGEAVVAPADAPADAPAAPGAVDPFDPRRLEGELIAAVEQAPFEPPMPTVSNDDGRLLSAPVARRARRDRPTDRRRGVLPTATSFGGEVVGADHTEAEAATTAAAVIDLPVEDRSPLPDPGLPPAATPVRPDRRSVLGATDAAGAPGPPSGEPAAGVESPVVPFIEDQGPVLEVRPDGLVVVPGTILRVRDHVGSIAAEPERVAVGVRQGWCWVSPGDGEPVPVRVDLPAASVTAPAGSTVLAVVERDGSSFVVVADGHARLDHPGGIDALTAGDVVMIDAVGAVQTDRATHEEIESDPLVAENLALDAEL